MIEKREPIFSIEIENLKIGYSEVSWDLPLKKVYFLKGDSGAGKSDFLKMIAGLKKPENGRVLINKNDINEMSFDEFLKFRLNIGYGFDMGGLISNKSLFENLYLPLEYHGEVTSEAAQMKVLYLLEYFDLVEIKDLRPAMVSASIKKIICVLRAFINDPEIVILDDVTIGLTEDHFAKLTEWIEGYIQSHPNLTLLMAVQNSKFMKNINFEEITLTRKNGFKFNKLKKVV